MGLIANGRMTCYGHHKLGNVAAMSVEGANGAGKDPDNDNRDSMVGFGPKQAWLAVRNAHPEQLTQSMGLRDLGEVSWRNGVDLAYLTDDRLALTPAMPGAGDSEWVLITGRWLLMATSTVDILELSATLDTEVQSFASYRVGEAHRWQRAVSGILVRSFAYVGERGEITQWRGDPDDTELAIGLPATVDPDSDVLVSEADVMRVAGAWSVDPSALDGQPAPGPLRMATAPQDTAPATAPR
jgi:hypothetical protein